MWMNRAKNAETCTRDIILLYFSYLESGWKIICFIFIFKKIHFMLWYYFKKQCFMPFIDEKCLWYSIYWWKIFRLPSWRRGKEPTCQCRTCKRRGFDPWFGKILWRRKWQPTLVFLPGKSHGQRSLAGSLLSLCDPSTGLQRVRHYWATEQAHLQHTTDIYEKYLWYVNPADTCPNMTWEQTCSISLLVTPGRGGFRGLSHVQCTLFLMFNYH